MVGRMEWKLEWRKEKKKQKQNRKNVKKFVLKIYYNQWKPKRGDKDEERKRKEEKERKEKKNKNRWKGKGAYLAVRAEKNVVISERKFSLSTKITWLYLTITWPLVALFFLQIPQAPCHIYINHMSSHNFQIIGCYLLQVIYSSYPFNWLRYSWNTSLNICPHGLFVQIWQVITESRQFISQIG